MRRFPAGISLLLILCCSGKAAVTVHLVSGLPSPQPVGTPIGLTPLMENTGKGIRVVRYSVSVDGGPFRIVRDFSQEKDYVWSPVLYEHAAAVRVTVRDNDTKETAQDELPFRIVSRVKDSSDVVTPTTHPLVALFSAPACPEGGQFRVAFRREGDESLQRTPSQPCRGTLSNNVYVAGMRADTEYRLRSEVVEMGGGAKTGEWMPFHTAPLDGNFPKVSVAVSRNGSANVSEPVLIYSVETFSGSVRPFATDLEGRIVWFIPQGGPLTRVLPGGHFLVLADGPNSVNSIQRSQVVRELDLAGNALRETNIGRVAEQLERFGIHSDCKKGGKECVSGFHHEAIRLPDGHTLAVAGLERMMPAGTQGSKEPVDVLGDIVVDLDEEFQVTAVWNCFDHLDIKRASLANAKCHEGAGRGGCPAIFLAREANGWTHSNSLNYIPSSGDFLVSMPEQNWVLKVDWQNGKGSGKILWRLGQDGDFKAISDDPEPWFSYQHDAGFEPVGSNMLSILDDGHERFKKNPKANTRGQVWKLDEDARTATLVYNADLGVYATAVGSAQTLKNGGYAFEAGFIPRQTSDPGIYGRSVETDAAGKVVFAMDVQGVIIYRSFRVDDMYSTPVK